MEILRQYQRISRLLSLCVRLRVKQVAPRYLDRIHSPSDPHSVYLTAIDALRVAFPFASGAEADVATFYLLGFLASALGDGRNDPLKDTRDSLAELGEEQLRI